MVIENKSSVQVYCHHGSSTCEKNVFIFYPEINHSQYKLEIELQTNIIDQNLNFISYSAVTANSKYTMFLLLLRYSLFFISIIFLARYIKSYWMINKFVRTFEHKMIFILGILLVFFNDPFYAATILKANLFFAGLSTLCVCVFVTALIIFWIVMMQRIHKEPPTPETKLLKSRITIIMGILVFGFLLGSLMIASVVSKVNPAFHMSSSYPRVYHSMKICLFLIAVVLILGFVYNSFCIMKSWNKILNRHKFFYLLSLYFILALFLLVLSGFYQSYDTNGIKILMVFVIYNFYVIVLQVMWKVTPKGLKEAKKIFNIDNEESANKKIGFEYFEDNLEVEITSQANNQDPVDKSQRRKDRKARLENISQEIGI